MPDINIKLNLADNGTIKKRNDDANELNHTLQKTQRILADMNKPKASYRAQAMPGGADPEELTSYGRARGAVGTGAAGRDFAKQAQGLGGLVHVYATFAANLFAVGAAFRALSAAADTTNMIKGLDQLGASTGRSLGALSKQLVEVTDGAVNMREAMTAVAQSTAAGMTSGNVLRLGTVAKQAAQALGLNLPDALSRLSRGITKLEPELLDELGIFVRVDTASQNYARSLGKTAASLTDFEKRQGFANEVLTQAEQKFGKINLAPNPYDKLLASTTNLIQKGLELVNTVLNPIVDLLSRSPLALSAVLAGIGTILIRQAIPAIGQYRQALQRASDDALLAVAGKSQAASRALAAKQAAARIEAEAVAQAFVEARDKATDRLEQLSKGKFATSKKRVATILEKGIYDITQEDINYLNKQAEKNKAKNQELSTSYSDLAAVIQGGQKAENDYQRTRLEGVKAEQELAAKSKQTLKEDAEFRQRSQAAIVKGIAATTYAQTAQVGVLKSVAAGWKEVLSARKGATLDVPIPDTFLKDPRDKKGKTFLLDEQGNKIQATTKVAVDGLSAVATAAGLARVAISGIAGGIASLISKLGTVGIAIGIATAVFQVLDSVLSDSGKEMQKLRNASDLLVSSIDTIGTTIEAIRTKKPEQILSVESIQARANAFNGLQDSLQRATAAFEDFGKKQNWWDRAIEGTQRFLSTITVGYSEKLFGSGPRKEMAENLSKSIINAIRLAESGPQREEITNRLSKLVGMDLRKVDQSGLTKALNQLDFSDLGAKSSQISKEITKLSNEANNNASKITSFKTALQDTARSADTLSASLALTDNFGKIATGLITSSMKMTEALKDPTNAITVLKEVIDNTQVLSLLPPDLANDLIAVKDNVTSLNTQLGVARTSAQAAREELARLKTAGAKSEDIARAEAGVASSDFIVRQVEERAKAAADAYSTRVSQALFASGVVYLERSLKNAMQEGAIAAAKGYVSALASLGANTAESETKLRLAELDLQKQQINAAYEAKVAQERNTIAVERNTLQREIDNETQKLQAAINAGNAQKQQEANDKLAELTRSMLVNTEKAKILANPSMQNIRGIQARPLTGLADLGYDKQAAAEMSSFVTTLYARQAQLAKIGGQEAAVVAEGIVKKNRALAEEKVKGREEDIKSKTLEVERLSNLESMIGIYDKTLAYKKLSNQFELIDLNALNEQEKIQADINSLKQLSGKFGKDSAEESARQKALLVLEGAQRSSVNKQLQDKISLITKARIAEIEGEDAKAKKFREYTMQEKTLQDDIASSALSIAESELASRQALGILTDQQAAEERARIDLAKQKLFYDQEILKIANKEYDLTVKKKKIDLITQRDGAEAAADLVAEYDREKQLVDLQRQSIESANDAKVRGIQTTKNLSSEFSQMSKIISNTFDKLADALVDFAQTGKFQFKDLIKSMLADMLRLQLQKQFRDFYGNLFGAYTQGWNTVAGGGATGSGTAAAAGAAVAAAGAAAGSSGSSGSSSGSDKEKDNKTTSILGGIAAAVGLLVAGQAVAARYGTTAGSQQSKMLEDQEKGMFSFWENLTDIFTGKAGIFAKIGDGIKSVFDGMLGIFGLSGSDKTKETEKQEKNMSGFWDSLTNLFSAKEGGIVAAVINGIGSLFKGIFSAVGSIFGISSLFGAASNSGAIASASSKGMFGGALSGDVGFAKGGLFYHGVQKFGKGGMFTNSIVDSPTMFKFAQGAGLMGEAGPEAIMPLKRDSSGNLGVRATNQVIPQTSVIVNNYGTEQATTRETTDSSGNRQIEVIIGDVVAQEVSRPGSSTQQALNNTFKARPALTRR